MSEICICHAPWAGRCEACVAQTAKVWQEECERCSGDGYTEDEDYCPACDGVTVFYREKK